MPDFRGDRIYSLYILDVNSGQLQEVIPLAEDLWAQPVTDGKNLYISSLDHSLIALDKNTNQVIWHEDLGSAIPSSPILAPDGNLYVGSFASNLEKFDPATGNHQSVQKTNDWVWGTPGVVENNLYFGDLSGNLYSFNIDQGKYDWTSTIKPADGSKLTAITATPLALNDFFLVATEAGSIWDVDKNGRLKNSPWNRPARSWWRFEEERTIEGVRVAILDGPQNWITVFVRGDYFVTAESGISLEENLKIVASLLKR